MFLKFLEIRGFKSFPDKTILNFNSGITAVVGPNGSGKSNISDAIRWVLGEQSSKSLRGTKMEDVIFNGTQDRKSLGFAEVSLTIDNTDRKLDFDNDEVRVTRRYYRSGDSDYMLNNANVRLRDIQLLFMDTGLGRDGYSIIGQGRVADIVASKSADRREIFEEAAGIAKYRFRKNEAERRLAMGAAWADSGLVAVDGQGQPLSPNAVSLAFTRFIRRSGLPKITLHGLRHTFATLASAQGVPLFDIGKALGHSTPATTGRIYTHLLDEVHTSTLDRVAAALK